jgi:hypothetical protein
MVIVKLNGGLGNQMFQYALGKSLALKQQTNLKLDISGFEHDKKRKYSLSPFKLKAVFATTQEIKKLTSIKQSTLKKIYLRITGKPSMLIPSYVRERSYNFDEGVLSHSGDIYIDGYWQSEKYFIQFKDTISSAFLFSDKQNDKNKELGEKICSEESVSIHIRRADYITDRETNDFHGTCSLSFYNRAIEEISQKCRTPHFYIFGDDPIWVRKKLRFEYPSTIVEHNNSDSDHEDLRLMSQCKHNIIANSSFSWWGAWLNTDPNKVVIAPEQWFADETVNRNTKDLIPNSWIKI